MSEAVLTALLVCTGAAAATLIGGAVVTMRGAVSPRVLAFGFAFAAGAMVYVSLVEILAKGRSSFAEVMTEPEAHRTITLWFFAGTLMIMAFERLLPHAPTDMDSRKAIGRAGLLAALAISAHNLPEGMATFFATLNDPSLGGKLAVAIAIHNIPEGVSVAVPLLYATGSRTKALIGTGLTALAEPVGGLLGYLILGPFLDPKVFGIVFGISAGAMVFLSLHELMPSARRHAKGYETAYGLVIGMATLAVSLVLLS